MKKNKDASELIIVRKDNTRYESDNFVMEVTPDIGPDATIQASKGHFIDVLPQFFNGPIKGCLENAPAQTLDRRILQDAVNVLKSEFGMITPKKDRDETKNFAYFTQTCEGLKVYSKRRSVTTLFKNVHLMEDGETFQISFAILRQMTAGTRSNGIEMQARLRDQKKLDITRSPRVGFIRIGNRYCQVCEPKKPGSL